MTMKINASIQTQGKKRNGRSEDSYIRIVREREKKSKKKNRNWRRQSG